MILYIVLGIIGLIALLALSVGADTRRLAHRIGRQLQAMDEQYAEFMDKQLTSHLLRQNDLDADRQMMVEAGEIFLKPQLNALTELLNASYLTGLSLHYSSRYFPNIGAWCERMMTKKRVEGRRVDAADAQELADFLRDALNADVQQRLLLLGL